MEPGEREPVARPAFDASDADWYMDAVFYEAPVRSIYDSDGDGRGDFAGLTQKLDYIQELGVDCIWILPMYSSPTLDDGYDIADFMSIHEDFGTVDDFYLFLNEAHKRGLRVIADLVLNHTSDQHLWFQEARNDPDSDKREFYVWTDDPTSYPMARIIFLDTETSNWSWDPVAGKYFWHRFFHHQPDLNYDNPAVHDAMFDVARYWLDMGLDGFRCDAVPYLYEREGTNCENLPETHQFLRKLRAMVDREYPGRVLLAEANQWPEDVIEYFGTPGAPEFHMNFHFPVMPRLFIAIRRQDRAPIVEIMARTPVIPAGCQWATFLRNHDELTLEMVTLEDRLFLWDELAPAQRMRSNLGIRRRLAPMLDNSRAAIELINAMFLSLPGAPCLYYGDEIGMGDNIWLRDRNGVRTPMQWSGDRGAGFSTAESFWAPVVSDGEFSFERVNVAAQRYNRKSLFSWMRKMLGIRRQHKSFSRGDLLFVNPADTAILAYVRRWHDESVLCVANLGDSTSSFELPLGIYTNYRAVDIIGGKAMPSITGGTYPLTLAPSSYLWLMLIPPAN